LCLLTFHSPSYFCDCVPQQTDENIGEGVLLEGTLGNNILKSNKGSRTGQRGKANCDTIAFEGSDDPTGNPCWESFSEVSQVDSW
jgi:hypothetical protein